MADETTQTGTGNPVDGGAPTPMEAQYAAELVTLGSDAPAPAPVADEGAAPAPAPVVDASGAAAAPAPAVDAAAAPTPAPAAAVVDTQAAAPAPPTPDPVAAAAAAAAANAERVLSSTPPPPPKDFDAESSALQKRWDDGEIDAGEYQKGVRALAREESQWTTRVEVWEQSQQTAAQQMDAEFNSAALRWEEANKEFMSNPLWVRGMQDAIQLVAQQERGLPASVQIDRAAKIAFEAFGYKPAQAVDGAAAVAAAAANRQPAPVPPTLASAAAAAPIDTPTTSSAFASLDAAHINDLENQLSRMSPTQLDQYLRDAPGATTTGI